MNQCNRIETPPAPKKTPHIYSQLIFNKSAMSIQWGKTTLSNNGAETTGSPDAQE